MRKRNYKEEGNKFHKKVEKILRNAGFKILFSNLNKKGPDIGVEVYGKKIIIQCKHSPGGNYFQKLDDEVDSYISKRAKFNADVAVIALSGYRHRVLKQSDMESWLQEGVAIWTDAIIDNYRSLVKSIGDYAKFQILGDLGLHLRFDDAAKIKVLEVTQHKKRFFTTKLTPDFLLRSSYVARIEQKPKFYQRYLSKKRVTKEIPDFIENEQGLFPNSIILVSNNKLAFKNGYLHIPSRIAQLWVIDGQHRLYSFCNVKNKNLLTAYELPCTIFDGVELEPREQARVFERINSQAKKTPAALITELAKIFGFESDRGMYLLKRFEMTPYFQNKVRSYSSRKGTIDAKTFTDCSSLKELVKDNGRILRGSGRLSEEKRNQLCYSYLYSFFKTVYNNFRKEWNRPSTYILCTNEGYRSLLRLFNKILVYTRAKKDERKFKEIVKAFKRSNPIIKLNETKGGFAGEGGAIRLANEWARGINHIIPDFDTSIERKYGEIIDRLDIKRGELNRAEEFIERAGRCLRLTLRGELDFVDVTTLEYLQRYFPNCIKFHIVYSHMKKDDKNKFNSKLKELNKEGKKFIFTKCDKVHERWLGDEHYFLELKADLKRDALANSDHEIFLARLGNDKEKMNKFDERWKWFENYTGRKIIFDWSLEKEDENNP